MTAALQVARRLVQLSVLAALLLIPSLVRYDGLRERHDEAGIAARWDSRLLDHWLGSDPDPQRVTRAVHGTVWTLTVGTTTIADPLAVLDFTAASRLVPDRFVLCALLPLLATLALGRVFCGWICPADLLFEVGSWMRRLAGIRTDVRFSRALKFAVLGVGTVAAAVLGTQVFAEIYPPRIVGGELYRAIAAAGVGAGAWFLVALLAFEIFVSRRFWCRYVCPGGALYSALGWRRVLRIGVRASACNRCGSCRRTCEFDLDPAAGDAGHECNNCGACMHACPQQALRWQLTARPAPRELPVGREGHER